MLTLLLFAAALPQLAFSASPTSLAPAAPTTLTCVATATIDGRAQTETFTAKADSACDPIIVDQSASSGRFMIHAAADRAPNTHDEYSLIHLQITDTVTRARSRFLTSDTLDPTGIRKLVLVLDGTEGCLALECRLDGSSADTSCHSGSY
jgi:hypothetical protein